MRGADYVIKRTAFALVTVFVAVTLNFALFRLAPGSAVTDLSRVPHATPELRQALKKQFGLDKSKGAQYVIYLKQLAHGNLGVSYENEQPVSTNLRIDLINTLPMVTLGTVFAIVWQMQKYLQQRKPYLWLANLDNVSAYSPNWTGIVTSPQGPFNSISKVSLTSIQQK